MIEPEIGWDGWVKLIEMVGAIAQNNAEKMMDDVSEEMLETLVDAIQHQSYRWAPLSPGYRAWKLHQGMDTGILIATREYIEAIAKTKPQKPLGRNVSYQPGDYLPPIRTWIVHTPEGEHKPSGLPYDVLARRLEFGVIQRNLPPRPHWSRAFRATATASNFTPKMKRLGNQVDRQLRTYLKNQRP